MHTVVIIEAGIGALSLGFAEAGFQVTEAYEKDTKAIDTYKKNIDGKIYECGLLELRSEEITDADVIAIDLMKMPSLRSNGQGTLKASPTTWEYLKKTWEIIKGKQPPAFCLVMQRGINKKPEWSDFLKEMSILGYHAAWSVVDTREITGLPVTEVRTYMIGSRVSSCNIQFPDHVAEKETISVREIASCAVEDDWYYRINREEIQESSREDSFLCWRRDKYVERPYADWNLMKMPLIRIDGKIHKLTHREIAELKGFPRCFDFALSNKAWLYRMLAYAPNVQITKRVANCLKDDPIQTPLHKMQAVNGQKFEKIFGSYLQQKDEKGNSTIHFELKFYSSNFSVKQNLYRVCRQLSNREKAEDGRIILVVANIVSDEVKESCKREFGVFVWDVKNLLWLFGEFPAIKNEFIALLNYTTEAIEPERPVPYVFGETEEKPENISLKEKLQRIKPGQGQFQQYEEVCVEILKYVLGDYLTMWNVQEKTDNGMYRFDLCCKIKNGASQDFFDMVQQYFNTKYIVFEFKNYSDKITQKEIYTTEKYLYEKALRRVAVIISRQGADDNALAAARGSLRETGKLILCLSDKDILELIDIKDKNEQSTGAFFEAMLDDLLIHLEK